MFASAHTQHHHHRAPPLPAPPIALGGLGDADAAAATTAAASAGTAAALLTEARNDAPHKDCSPSPLTSNCRSLLAEARGLARAMTEIATHGVGVAVVGTDVGAGVARRLRAPPPPLASVAPGASSSLAQSSASAAALAATTSMLLLAPLDYGAVRRDVTILARAARAGAGHGARESALQCCLLLQARATPKRRTMTLSGCHMIASRLLLQARRRLVGKRRTMTCGRVVIEPSTRRDVVIESSATPLHEKFDD